VPFSRDFCSSTHARERRATGFRIPAGCLAACCAHLSLRREQSPAHHSQVEQRKQRDELGGVLLQSAKAHLHVAELALDYPERVLDLHMHARLELLDLADQRVDLVAFVQRPALARAQGDAPVHARPGVRPPGRALVTRIGEDDALLPVQQAVGFDHVIHIARHRRQDKAAWHLETGRHLPAHLADPRGKERAPSYQGAWTLAGVTQGPKTVQRGHRRAGGQDRPNDLGCDGAAAKLPAKLAEYQATNGLSWWTSISLVKQPGSAGEHEPWKAMKQSDVKEIRLRSS
jgi:hypothetical protein